jgi:hypothetical protein
MSETALKITHAGDEAAMQECRTCLTRYTGHHNCGPSDVDEEQEEHGCYHCGHDQFTARRESEDIAHCTVDEDRDLAVGDWTNNWTDDPTFRCDNCGEEWDGHAY